MKLNLRSRFPRARAFTLIEVLVVAGTMVVLATVGIAGLNYQQRHAAGLACGNNLRLIQEAKRAALEDDPTLTSFDDSTLTQYIPGGAMPTCPGRGTYQNTDSLKAVASCTLNSGLADGVHNPTVPGMAAPGDNGSIGLPGGPIRGGK